MCAADFSEPGPAADVRRIVDRALPVAGAGEVRVRIVLAAVNLTGAGTWIGPGGPGGVAPARVPNQDGSGVVDALGEGVRGLEPGDRVWVWDAGHGRERGTAQDYVVLPRRQVVRMNDDIPFEAGAAAGVPALTAHRCLTVAGDGPARLAPGALRGRTVLVAGGAGAVGNAAIQLAKWAGATVLTTVSGKDRAESASAAGADAVIDHREQDVAARVREVSRGGPSLIVEGDTANLELDLEVIAPGGHIAIHVGGPVSVPSLPAMRKNISLDFVLSGTTTPAEQDNAVAAVAAAVNARALRAGEEHGLPILRFPSDGVAQAHEAVENHAVGQVMIEVTRP
jgi:NADPH2:quinone reductase